ncbi:uncharacterized protein [Leptinotarsa decemlineata]|uniref:uncharacterized protein n=1 Tax=Leptinotarsa decemlineata TaxID=7539 RepID=UPI003D30C4FB
MVPGTKRGLKFGTVPSLRIPGFQGKPDHQELSASEPVGIDPDYSSTNEELIYSVPSTSSFQELQDEITRPSSPLCKPVALPRGISKRKYILREVNVTRAIQLTPKANTLYKKVKTWSTQMNRMQKQIISFKEHLANATKIANSPNFESLLKYVNDPTYTFIESQIQRI